MTDYELICEITGENGEEAIDSMISSATKSNISHIFNTTFNSTQIVEEYDVIDNVYELNYILKKENVLLSSGNLSKYAIDNELAIVFEGVGKNGKPYSQIRWTQKGKEYLFEIINKDKNTLESDSEIMIKVLTTKIKEDEFYSDEIHYAVFVTDIFDRVWRYSGVHNYETGETIPKDGMFKSYEEAQKFEREIKEKGFFNPEYYWTYSNDDCLRKKFDSIEKIMYISSSDDNQYIDNCWRLYVTTKGGFYYEHEKKFKDYNELVKLAITVQKKGIVNLKYWECMGGDDSETWQTNIKELQKEEYVYR